jgi:hypothetical protein
MNLKRLATQCALFGALIGISAVPLAARAQTVTHWVNRQLHVDDHYHGPQRHRRHSHHSSGSSWQSLAYVGGGVAVAGILTHDPVLTGIGLAGGLYSTYRFEQDRNSSNAADRRRFAYFNQQNRTIHGHQYHRVTVMSNGHHYYGYKRT